MKRSRPLLSAIPLVIALTACATNPQATETASTQLALAELRAKDLQAKDLDEDVCLTVFKLAISIMTSRHLLAFDRKDLEKQLNADYPGYDNTIASMINEAFRQKPLGSIGAATSAGTQLKDKWFNELGTCSENSMQA